MNQTLLTYKIKRQTCWGHVQETTRIQEATTTNGINYWFTPFTRADILAKDAIQLRLPPLANMSTPKIISSKGGNTLISCSPVHQIQGEPENG